LKKSWLSILILALFVFCVSQAINSCSKKNGNSGGPKKLTQEIPDGFPEPTYTFENNPLTEQGFQLGRKLFYDGRLSRDGNFPCASCHQQFAAFSTFDHNLSHGFNNAFTTRNAPALFNLAWEKEFHHDGGINNIEVQPLAPITAPNEMAETLDNIINKLNADEEYRKMFAAAFGDETINTQRILKALAQFTASIVSADSKYDRVMKGKARFDDFEQRGYTLFKAKCSTCHPEPLFTDHSYRNIGLPLDPYLLDVGRMRITNDPADSLKFKVPSLRNINLTYPYMHDGRFYGLTECVSHYRKENLTMSSTLDPQLANGIALSDPDVTDLVFFLRTLTDSTLLSDPRFAQPQQ
jgi:cytochrome c peroxidase